MPPLESTPRILKFGVFQVDTRAGEVFKHGIRIKLQDQPFQVLLVLMEKAGEVVSREELRQRLWSEQTFVDFDHSLNIAVNKLRDALGDSAESPRFVETLPKRGYRFLAPVSSESLPAEPGRRATHPSPTPRPEGSPKLEIPAWEERTPEKAHRFQLRRKLVLFAAALAIGAMVALWRWGTQPAEPSTARVMLAVLPLQNLSGDAAQEYFISGLHDEMISQLGRMHAARLSVIARASVLQYAGTQKPIREIGRELNVDYVLEGTVRRAADRVRIAVRLIKVSDQTPLWSEQFDRMPRDVIELQSDVAQRVAESLALELLPRERAAMGRAPTAHMGAYEDYLRGRYNWNRRTEDGFLQGIAYFEDAVRKDPNFALAHAGIADCYNLMGGYGFQPPQQAYPKAKMAAARALELDPNLAETHAALGFTKFYFDWDWPGAERSFGRALESYPNLAVAWQWYGEYLHAMGRLDEAETAFRRALELDPFSVALNDDLGWLQLSRDRIGDAIEQFRRTRRLDPAWTSAYTSLAFALARTGRFAEASAELEALRAKSGETIGLLETSAYVEALAGRGAAAREALRRLRARAATSRVSPYSLALIHLALGEQTQALGELERGLEQRDSWLLWLKVHPEWEPLRGEARFQQVLRKLNL